MKYISDTTIYIDAGHNAGLQEGMKLSVVQLPPDGLVTEGIRYRDYPHVAELNVVSVADTSAVCDVISTTGELKIGQIAFLTPGSFGHLSPPSRKLGNSSPTYRQEPTDTTWFRSSQESTARSMPWLLACGWQK